MTVKYCLKTHQTLITGIVDKYYSDPEMDTVLATAERFVIQARVSTSGGSAPNLTVGIETSNDAVNWQPRSTVISGVAVNGQLFGAEKGETTVGGRYMRVWAQMGGGGTVYGFVELWVCGRSFY